MSNRDGTGPMGQGPLTGRGLGPCTQGLGLRRGFRQGFGRGFRRCLMPFGSQIQQVELSKDDQKKILQAELAEIEAEKIAVEKELKELKA